MPLAMQYPQHIYIEAMYILQLWRTALDHFSSQNRTLQAMQHLAVAGSVLLTV
jgi:hypothetical protein